MHNEILNMEMTTFQPESHDLHGHIWQEPMPKSGQIAFILPEFLKYFSKIDNLNCIFGWLLSCAFRENYKLHLIPRRSEI